MRIIIIGSLSGQISEAGKIAIKRGAKVLHCENIDEGINALLNGKGADAALVDVKQDIAKFVVDLESNRIHMPVIACGIDNDARAAVKAIKDGAKEYLPLPPDAELIAAVLEAISEDQSDMIADDEAMKRVVVMAKKVAPSEATILITGESGTGKEVMSRFIHNNSKRKDGEFIAVNCAAIPENLLESELFGHEKGAFTGATGKRIGKFEEANGGTILLDEITEMDASLQAKLLRVLQEREITRVGANKPVKIDVRVLATSNRDMEEAVRDKVFREDLYFRLNVVNLDLPPLRERPSDIARLAQFFADKYSEANGVAKKKVSGDAISKMQNYGWKGNIRELENTMHRAVLISIEDEIEADAVHIDAEPSAARKVQETSAENVAEDKAAEVSQEHRVKGDNSEAVEQLLGRSIADVERQMILDTLDHCLGNRTQASKILGISIRTLRNKLNQYKEAS